MTPLLNLTQIHPPLFKMKNDSVLSNKFDKSNKNELSWPISKINKLSPREFARVSKLHPFWDQYSFFNYRGQPLNQERAPLLDRLNFLSKANKKLKFFPLIIQKENLNTLMEKKQLNNVPFGRIYTSSEINKNSLYNSKSILITRENEEKWRRWSANQYFTYQGKDTDLFIDIHPPKTFRNLSVIKYYEPIHQPIGNLVCQIYSGIFYKQVAKNVLIVGAPGSGKTAFIQALAGETELKIITDNANRYALVLRGVAVGMKLLRDVFDAIALHTPCLFLMEDIHVIGERRPLLISDDENAKATEPSLGFEREEVHEKNQVIYQLSRHSISHYKKPYKGDFSLLIPTNHFCFDLFLGVSPPRSRRLGMTPPHPLPLDFISSELKKQNESNTHNHFSQKEQEAGILETHLQLPYQKLFAPPSTSPFTILVLKQQKKLKSRKLVKPLPWGGLSLDQMTLIPKITYSIKVKIALLAEIAISNLTVKLDIITDLLIIIDSVRSNRGFVVFATTHIPYVLDPALRRPGRLDETISLPVFPNLLSRWEILKSFTSNFSNTLDLIDYAIFSQNCNEIELKNLVSRTKLLLCAPIPVKNVFSLEDFLSISRFNFIDKNDTKISKKSINVE